MTAWIDTLNGRRRSTRAWDASERSSEVGYGGPADGDFARYVEQLLAQAEHQRRPPRDARAPAPASAPSARRTPVDSPPARARPAAPRDASPGLALPAWRKPMAFAFWLVLALALFFWQGAMTWLVGLLVVGAIAFNAVRLALNSKKR